jgi:uncharacterized membrane protein
LKAKIQVNTDNKTSTNPCGKLSNAIGQLIGDKYMVFENIILVLAGILTALVTGLYFGYSVSVNGGLHRLNDSEYVKAMQSINVAIQNPIFFVSFIGPLLLLPLATFLKGDTNSMQFTLLLASSVLYIAGSFGLTMVGNVPLNQRLARFDVTNASGNEIAQARAGFEKPWNRFHTIRTLASIAATVLLFIACLLDNKNNNVMD